MTVNFSKSAYTVFCTQTDSVSVFMQPWFLDAVCGADGWVSVLVVADSGAFLAASAFPLHQKWGQKWVSMPFMAGFGGLWVAQQSELAGVQHRFENRVLQFLVQHWPKTAFFYQFLPVWHTNLLPFYWAGFQNTALTAYVLSNIKDENRLWAGLKDTAKQKIRKAEKRVQIEISTDFEAFWSVYVGLYHKLGRPIGRDKAVLAALHAHFQSKNCGKLFLARDTEGGLHAALYVVWDKQAAYYWAAGSVPQWRSSGAMSLVLWRALQTVAAHCDTFMALGSMSPELASFINGFGFEPKNYHKIYKYGAKWAEYADFLRRQWQTLRS